MIPSRDSPSEQPDAFPECERVDRVSRLVRIAIYTHIVSVASTGIGMTHDVQSVIWPDHWVPFLRLALLIGETAFWVCPVLLIVGILRSSISTRYRMLFASVGVAIAYTHFVALIPSVQ